MTKFEMLFNTQASVVRNFFIGLICVVGFAFPVNGQIVTPGTASGSSPNAYRLGEFDSVDYFSGNLSFKLPLPFQNARGKGMPTYYDVTPDGWKVNVEYTETTPNNFEWFYTAENRPKVIRHFGTAVAYGTQHSNGSDFCSPSYKPANTLTTLYIYTSDGNQIELRDVAKGGQMIGINCNNTDRNRGQVFNAVDSSGATFITNQDIFDSVDATPPVGESWLFLAGTVSTMFSISGELSFPDGTKYQFLNSKLVSISDRNGNKTTISNTGGIEISESTGRVLTFSSTTTPMFPDTSTTIETIQYKGVNGSTREMKVYFDELQNQLRDGFAAKKLNELFPDLYAANPASCIGCGNLIHNPIIISKIVLPNSEEFDFEYNSYGELAKVVYPTGSTVEYDWMGGVASENDTGDFALTGDARIYRRVVERRQYEDGINLTKKTTISRLPNATWTATPLTTIEVETFDSTNRISKEKHYFNGHPLITRCLNGSWKDGKEYKTELFDSDGSTILLRETKEWSQDSFSFWYCTGDAAAPNNPKISEATTEIVSTNQIKKTTYSYDQRGNQTDVYEYDFGNGQIGGFLRRSHTDFLTINPVNSTDYLANSIHLTALPSRTWISSDAGGNNKVSLTTFEYDNYASDANHAALVSRSNVIGHDTTNYGTGFTKRGNLTSTTTYANAQNQTGGISTYAQYDILGNVVKTIDAGSNATTISYNDNFGAADGEATTNSAPVSLGGLNTFAYATGTTNSLGWTAYTQYDYYTGAPVNTQDLNGLITKTLYDDPLDRPTRTFTAVGTPLESQSKIVYDDANRRVETTSDLKSLNDDLIKAESFYDGLGRTIESRSYKDVGYTTVKTEYDALGRVKQVTNPYRPFLGETPVWTKTKYDALSRVIEVETPDGAKAYTAYSGNRTLVTDQAGKQRISVSNALGQLKQIWEITASDGAAESVAFPGHPSITHGYRTDYGYDTLGNLTTVTQGVQTRTFAYDSLSRLKQATNPESGTISYSYDNNGNLTSKTDARSITTSYTYDALNRVTQRSYAGEVGYTTPAVSYFYDSLANAKGRLIKVSSSVSTTEYTSFDILGRVTGHKQTTDGQSYSTAYAYNLSGALVEQTYPSGRVVKNVIDTNGDLSMVQSARCSEITGVNASCTNRHGFFSYARNFSYNAAGAVTSMQLGNGRWESTQFNSRLQPTQIALGATNGATDLLKLDYSYGTTNNNGNVLSQTITVPSVGLNTGFVATQNYTYDSLNRIKDATENITPTGGSSSQSWKQAFTYDRYGNRNFDEANTTTLPKECNGNTEVCAAIRPVVNPSVNAVNNRLNGYIFDASGNTVRDTEHRRFTYDAENKQVKVETLDGSGDPTATIGEYVYDGDGKRIKKSVPGTGELTVFVYDAAGKLIGEYSSVVADAGTAKVSYLTNDHLGSPRINTDETGSVTARHDYHPFGEEITAGRAQGLGYAVDTMRKQFTGYERDGESSLDYAKARMYGYGYGRFTSPDPLMASARRINPQTWNRYIYVGNNPLKYTDPSGMDWGERTLKNGDTEYCYAPGKALCKGFKKYTGDGILTNPRVNGRDLGYAIRLLPGGNWERVVPIDLPNQGRSWLSQKDVIAINAISAGALCSLSAGLACPSSMDKEISGNVQAAGDAVQVAFLVKALLKAGLSLAAIAAVLKKDPEDIAKLFPNLSIKELNRIWTSQKPIVEKAFGISETAAGPEAAQQVLNGLRNGNIPEGIEGITRESLLAYREIAIRAINGPKGDPRGTQILRVEIIDELLKHSELFK